MYLAGGVYPSMHWTGGVYPNMHWATGQGGVYQGGCLLRAGLSAQGGAVCQRGKEGCLPGGWGCAPPVDRQTPVKT